MLKKYFKIRDSVEVFSQQNGDLYVVQFYRINTRESLYIQASEQTLQFLSYLTGEFSLSELAEKYNIVLDDLVKFVEYLTGKGLVVEVADDFPSNHRYSRQIAYFEDLLPQQNGKVFQENLTSKKIVIFGVGGVGSAIAILLARMGVKHFTLIDHKKLNNSHLIKHFYCDHNNFGQFKTKALREYLLKINSSLQIETIDKKLFPRSDLSSFIADDVDLVINTADEPYIGHISIKLGRYLWSKKIAMYVAGGFDAHSMSTGEMVVPHITPCIDCYSGMFREALKDYKPTYIIQTNATNQEVEHDDKDNPVIMGGPGSIASCSLFSASYACMRIVYYLLGVECDFTKRGEYLIDQGEMTWVNLGTKRCEVCHV